MLSAKPLFLTTKCPNLITMSDKCHQSYTGKCWREAKDSEDSNYSEHLQCLDLGQCTPRPSTPSLYQSRQIKSAKEWSSICFLLGKPIPDKIYKAKLLQQPPERFELPWQYDQYVTWSWHHDMVASEIGLWNVHCSLKINEDRMATQWHGLPAARYARCI